MRGCTLKTLFIDSSRKSLSIALAEDDKLLLVSNVNSYSKHSNFLMNEIQNILTKTQNTIYDIDNIVVLNGPGSFTGVRVGVTIAKTIAWCLSKKLYVMNNLEALRIVSNDEVVISVIADKKDSSYVGIYDSSSVKEDYYSMDDGALTISDKNITLVAMEESEFFNNLKDKLSKNNNVKVNIIDDYDYIKLISYALLKKNINPHFAEPIYLKKIDAEKKKNDN